MCFRLDARSTNTNIAASVARFDSCERSYITLHSIYEGGVITHGCSDEQADTRD